MTQILAAIHPTLWFRGLDAARIDTCDRGSRLVLCSSSLVAADPRQTCRAISKSGTPSRSPFDGPETSETSEPNPFTDYRLDVTFTGPSGELVVPGFFAADGQSAETSAESGSRWLVRFAPSAKGRWRYRASFRTGQGVALSHDPSAGQPTAFDGATGEFMVATSDKQLPDFRSRGRLEYVGERYPKFAGDGSYFLKGGAGQPGEPAGLRRL